MQRSFDVLARAEAIDRVVHAAARILACRKRADLHLVAGAARRADPIGAEEAIRRLQSFDRQDLGSASPEPARDLLLVAGAPPNEAGRSIHDASRNAALPASTCV